jgi:hypothetical protein
MNGRSPGEIAEFMSERLREIVAYEVEALHFTIEGN